MPGAPVKDRGLDSDRTVVVALSGGVDSAVAAALLQRDGYEVIAITLQIWEERAHQDKSGGCCSLDAVEDARRAATRLGIPHYVIDAREAFARSVVEPFVREYAAGRTPNPCVECNRTIKFEYMLERAMRLGASRLATGHYARITTGSDGVHRLRCAAAAAKDQSYVLYMLDQEQLARLCFPLGELPSKAQTREIALELGLAVANKPDSQEICFVDSSGYGALMQARAPDAMRPGPIIDLAGKVLGRHSGLANYTIGQRRRLPAGSSGPIYVVRLDTDANTLVVGPDEALYSMGLEAADVHWIADRPARSLAVLARIRYNAPAVPATVTPDPSGAGVRCRFDQPQRAVTPGQVAVFYRGDEVLGGGTITRPLDRPEE